MSAGSGLFDEGPRQGRFTQGKGGVAGEIDDLREDVKRNLAPLSAFTVREFINPILGAAGSLKAATATAAETVVLGTADLIEAALTNMADNPRQLVFTTAGATPAHAPATATVRGKDPRGEPLTEVVSLVQEAGAVTTKYFFSELDEEEAVSYVAADGTGATIAVGLGAKLGLSYAPKVREGGAVLLAGELEDGAAPTAGVVAAGANDLPYGSYTPNSALNGAHDFIVSYEFDPTQL